MYICRNKNNEMNPIKIEVRDDQKGKIYVEYKAYLFEHTARSLGYGYKRLSIHAKINIRQAYSS